MPITLSEDSNDGKCNDSYDDDDSTRTYYNGALLVWHAGDWTGPHSLQPEQDLADKKRRAGRDVVAVSTQGVKVRIVNQELFALFTCVRTQQYWYLLHPCIMQSIFTTILLYLGDYCKHARP